MKRIASARAWGAANPSGGPRKCTFVDAVHSELHYGEKSVRVRILLESDFRRLMAAAKRGGPDPYTAGLPPRNGGRR